MKNSYSMRRRAAQYGLAFAFALASHAAGANDYSFGSIDPVPDTLGGYVVPTLTSVVNREMEQLAAVLATKPEISTSALKDLKQKVGRATAVHGDYVWSDSHGIAHRKSYYGLSGRDLDELIPEDVSTAAAVGSRARARAAFADFESKLADTLDVDAKTGKPVSRALDAELKLSRTLERDIVLKKVPPGGRLDVFVSQAPCDSCKKVLEDLAQLNPARPITVRTYFLPENPGKLADALSAQFHTQRIAAVNKVISPERIRAAQAIAAKRMVTAGCL